MRTELVDFVTRELQLTLEQVASMAIPTLVGPAGKPLQVFPGDKVSPSLYPYKVDPNKNYTCTSPTFLLITVVVTGMCEVTNVVLL